MKNKFPLLLFILITLCLISGCSVEWTKAIRSGEITQSNFREKVNIEIQNGLIFLPVIIEGKEYRFLFDSGAPFSVSKKIQNEHVFKIVSEGNIIDSDHNRKKVLWAQVNAINELGLCTHPKERGKGVNERKWAIEMNQARALYLATHGKVDRLDHLMKNTDIGHW